MRVDKAYAFDTEAGTKTLKELFDGRSQLLVYHFMFGPDYTAGCPSCSMIADGFDGFAVHLANHDVTLTAVSRAPLDKLLAYRRGWAGAFPGRRRMAATSISTSASASPRAAAATGRSSTIFARGPRLATSDTGSGRPLRRVMRRCDCDAATFRRERPGMSAFALEDGVVYHAYSTYARGLDGLWGAFQWLDRAPKGRNQQGVWWRRHDEYGHV